MKYENIIEEIFNAFPHYKKFFLKKGEIESIDLPYVVITYLLDYYFISDDSEKKRIEDSISAMIVSEDHNVSDLAFAGFFEAH